MQPVRKKIRNDTNVIKMNVQTIRQINNLVSPTINNSDALGSGIEFRYLEVWMYVYVGIPKKKS